MVLHAGLDLSRRRLDYCLLDEVGERVEVGAVSRADFDGDRVCRFPSFNVCVPAKPAPGP